jgi:FdrA protein
VEQKNILEETVSVINIGLEGFAEDLREAGVEVVQVDWRPPSGGNSRLTALLANLDDEE